MNRKKITPKGQLKVIGTQLSQKNGIALYLKIILEDEAKKKWIMSAAAFLFDLKENFNDESSDISD